MVVDPQRKKPVGKRALKSNIESSFSDNIGRLAKMIAKGKRNEDETRRWVIDILKQGLGYADEEIETECFALGKRVDIALVDKQKIIAVIECKAVNVAIKQTAVNQVANYATSLGVEWAVVTNAQSWSLYHVEQDKNSSPEIIEVFNVELLDEDGISKYDICNLYFLTKKSILSGETEAAFHYSRITEQNYIVDAIFSDAVLKSLTKEIIRRYKKDFCVDMGEISVEDVKDLLEIYLDPLRDE